MGFIQNNALLVFAIGLFLILSLTLAIIKLSGNTPSKPKKVEEPKVEPVTQPEPEKKPEEKPEEPKQPEEKPEEETEKKPEEEKKEEEEKEEEEDKKKKKKKKKETEEPKVEPVFKPKEKEEPEQKPEEEKPEENTDDMLGAMAFVKTSKTISKLARKDWIETPPESEFTTEELIAIDDIIREKEIEDANTKTKHFDKSIRLSNFSQGDDYDAMFVSHISDKRTRINEHQHLNINANFMNRLYERTYKTLERSGMNSRSSVKPYSPFDDSNFEGDLSDQLNDQREEFAYLIDSSYKDSQFTELPDGSYMDDTLNLGAENILVTDTVLHRKNRGRK